jgi:hypothetical protein
MRRQGQEQGLSALEVHPLEGLRIAWLAGPHYDIARFSGSSY